MRKGALDNIKWFVYALGIALLCQSVDHFSIPVVPW